MITTRISVLPWFESPLMSARYSSPLRNDLSSAKLILFFMVHSFPTPAQISIAGSRLWLRPVGIPYINTLPSFEDRYGPIFNQRIYVIIFHFLSKIISFIIYLGFILLFFAFKMGPKWSHFGDKKFGEHSPNSVVLLHFAAEIAYCCFHLLHRQKKPRRVHASAKRYQILASNSDGVNATTLLWAKSRTFRVII